MAVIKKPEELVRRPNAKPEPLTRRSLGVAEIKSAVTKRTRKPEPEKSEPDLTWKEASATGNEVMRIVDPLAWELATKAVPVGEEWLFSERTMRYFQNLVRLAMKNSLALTIAGRGKRIELERRVAELEGKAMTFADAYRGVWRGDVAYKRGEIVTSGGSLWLATCDTNTKPGAGRDFRLIVKKGRDARHTARE